MLPNSEKRAAHHQSFILSLWTEAGERSPWRFSLENPRTAERIGFKQLDELMRFLQAWTQNSDLKGDGKPFGSPEFE